MNCGQATATRCTASGPALDEQNQERRQHPDQQRHDHRSRVQLADGGDETPYRDHQRCGIAQYALGYRDCGNRRVRPAARSGAAGSAGTAARRCRSGIRGRFSWRARCSRQVQHSPAASRASSAARASAASMAAAKIPRASAWSRCSKAAVVVPPGERTRSISVAMDSVSAAASAVAPRAVSTASVRAVSASMPLVHRRLDHDVDEQVKVRRAGTRYCGDGVHLAFRVEPYRVTDGGS